MKRLIAPSFWLALAVLLAGELVVRVAFQQRMSGRFHYGYHPTAGFEEENGVLKLVKAGGRRFHEQEISVRRPPGVFRILTIGDSVARGPSLEASYPAQLAEELKRRGVNAEGVNLAVAGYGARRKLVVLRQALKYEPSLVILHLNSSNEYEDEREFNRSEEFKSWHPRNWLMKSQGIRRLYEVKTEKVYWRWLPTEIRNQRQAADADAELRATLNPAKLREWTQRFEQITAESIALARQQGVPVLLVTQCLDTQAPDGTRRLDDGGLDALGRSLQTNGVHHLSMKDTFERLERNHFADGSHVRAEGHVVLANAIADLLERVRLVVPARRP